MLGYIRYGDGPKKPELGESRLPGGVFLTLRVREIAHPNHPLVRRRVLAGAKRLRELGVRSAVFPMDFPYTQLFIRQGIVPVDTLPLRRRLAAPLVRRRLESMGLSPTQAVVAVSAERLSREAMDAVRLLALSFRYVLLWGGGGEELARSLRREYGVSLLLGPSRDQLDRADALLLFSPRQDLALRNPVLYTLYPGGEAGAGRLPLQLPAAVVEQLDPNCDQEQMAAALYSLGGITAGSLLAEIPC